MTTKSITAITIYSYRETKVDFAANSENLQLGINKGTVLYGNLQLSSFRL